MILRFMLSIVMLVMSAVDCLFADEVKDVQSAPESHRVVVYYLHNTWRCPGCNSVESLSKAAVVGGRGENSKFGTSIEVAAPFNKEEKGGLISFVSVNIDKKENKQLLKDLGDNLKVPVIAEFTGDKIVSIVVLSKAWVLLGDNEAFVKYVQDGVAPVLAKFSQQDDVKERP